MRPTFLKSALLAAFVLPAIASFGADAWAKDPVCESAERLVAPYTAEKIRTFISNKTYRSTLSGHGNQIEYASADGRVYLWYPGNKVILPGRWKTMETGVTDNKFGCKAFYANICFAYGPNSWNPVTGQVGGWECTYSRRFMATRAEVVAGDPLDLQHMKNPPFPLPKDDLTIGQVKAMIVQNQR